MAELHEQIKEHQAQRAKLFPPAEEWKVGNKPYELIRTANKSPTTPVVTHTEEKRYFGVPIEKMMNKLDNGEYVLPQPIQELFDLVEKHLQEEGIFRLPGHDNFMKDVIQRLEEGKGIEILQKAHFGHSIAGIIKQYVPSIWFLFCRLIRELPEPLLTFEAFDELLPLIKNAPKTDSPIFTAYEQQMMAVVKEFIKQLPPANAALTRIVFTLLYHTQQQCNLNKMTASNLGIIFGMNVFKSRSSNLLTLAQNHQYMAQMVEILIDKYAQVFGETPSGLASNIPAAPTNGLEMLTRQLNALAEYKEEQEKKRKALSTFSFSFLSLLPVLPDEDVKCTTIPDLPSDLVIPTYSK